MSSRLKLLSLMVLFLLPLLAAVGLQVAGWRPSGSRAHGELLSPARALAPAVLLDGASRPIPWRDAESSWHLLILAPAVCDARCPESIELLSRVWLALHRDTRRLRLHWLGPVDVLARMPSAIRAPLGAARLSHPEALSGLDLEPRTEPRPGTALPLLLVDPDGHLAAVYRPGFDPSGLRKDLSRIIR